MKSSPATPSVGRFVQKAGSNFPDTRAAMKKNASTTRERTVMPTVNFIVASMPMMLIPTKIT